MNMLTLRLRNPKNNMVVMIDGKKVKLESHDLYGYIATYESEASSVNLKIYSVESELLLRFWFLRFLMYYFFSIFGIFDIKYDKAGYTVDYEGTIALDGDTLLDLSCEKAKDGERAFRVNSGDFDDNDTNVVTFNKKVSKRYKIMWAFKIVSWILLTILCAYFLMAFTLIAAII